MEVDSIASNISIPNVPKHSVIKHTEYSTDGVDRLVPQSGRRAEGKICLVCKRSFRRVTQLKRHQKRMHSVTGKFKCPACTSTFDKEHSCERHWHFEHSNVTHRCPECLEKLQPDLLREHIQRVHPNSIFALFGLKLEDCKFGESPNRSNFAGLKPSLSDTGCLEGNRALDSEPLKTAQLAIRSGPLSGNEYVGKRVLNDGEPRITKCPNVGKEIAPVPLPQPRYIEDSTINNYLRGQREDGAYAHFGNASSPLHFGNPISFKGSTSHDSVMEAHKKELSIYGRRNSASMVLPGPQKHSQFYRSGSASSLDFCSGSRRQSHPGSVVSSMNNSLHGYEIFDAEEQNMASPISPPQSALGSGSGAEVSGFRLPPPPSPLGKLSSFECDICGGMVRIKRKRDWR
jgi:hypothetical protein